jgi:hypothetical protein
MKTTEPSTDRGIWVSPSKSSPKKRFATESDEYSIEQNSTSSPTSQKELSDSFVATVSRSLKEKSKELQSKLSEKFNLEKILNKQTQNSPTIPNLSKKVLSQPKILNQLDPQKIKIIFFQFWIQTPLRLHC